MFARTKCLGAALLLLMMGGPTLFAQGADGVPEAVAIAPERGDDTGLALLERPALLAVEELSMERTLHRLGLTSGVPLAFSAELLPEDQRVTCDCMDLTVGDALQEILSPTDLRFVTLDRQILIEPRPEAPRLDLDPTPGSVVAMQLSQELRSLPPAPAPAVQTGQVQGRTVDQGGAPLGATQVHFPELGIGVFSGSDGRFTIEDVPAGTHELRAERLGYRPVTTEVSVVSGEVVEVTMQLAQEALGLDEIIVTGTPGGTQRRAIGNVVGQIDAGSLTQTQPILNTEQLVGSRNPGVVVRPSPGMVGTGTGINIRGVSSITQGNHPLIYIDGIRVDNAHSAGPPLRQGRQVSRLNDLNQEDIESIEIIKGPAAATLYGTEASAGVIQIITKQGADGAPAFDFSVRQGAMYMQDPAGRLFKQYHHNAETGVTDSINLYQHHADQGNPVFQYGHLQQYTAAVRGGTEILRYYGSADYTDNEGIVDYNWQNRFSTRLNLSVVPSDRWSVDTNLGFVRNHTRFAQAAPGFGIWDMLVWGRPDALDGPTRGFVYAPPEIAGQIDSRMKYHRFTGSFRIQNNPFDWLHQRATVGLDIGDDVSTRLFPRVPAGQTNWFGARGTGEKLLENTRSTYTTVDYGVTADLDLTSNWNSATSVGVQYYHRLEETSGALGQEFPIPAVTTVSGAASRQGEEDFIENKTLGTYVQQQFGYEDRIFVTAALRADDNSAFGAEFDAAYYPKFSATWVISEEGFWNVEQVNQLRFRTAWGQAGQQPDVFDAITLFAPTTGPMDQPTLRPASLGNPELKPEVGEELEIGFDAGLFEDRASMTFTYYTRSTKDAILARATRPSGGFPGSQIVNVGEIKNWGWELELNTQLYSRPGFDWDLGVNFATHENEVIDTGDLNLFRDRPGYPLAGIWAHEVVEAEFVPGSTSLEYALCVAGPENLDQVLPCGEAEEVFWGTPNPTWSGTLRTDFTIGGNLRLGAMAEFRGGHHQVSGDINAGHTSFSNTRAVNPVTDPILQAYRTVVDRTPSGIYDAGFARLRELSASYTLPTEYVERTGASRAMINVSWRNPMFLWRAQEEVWGSKIFDPETATPGDNRAFRHQTTIPPTAQVMTTLRVTF